MKIRKRAGRIDTGRLSKEYREKGRKESKEEAKKEDTEGLS